MAELRIYKDNKLNDKSRWLQEHAYNYFSQSGEDGILEAIFDSIGTTNKHCIEFGAWDGKEYSNTWHLTEQGWETTQIEADSERFVELQENYKNKKSNLINELVSLTNINDLLSSAPNEPDLISIDVDGNDIHIWESLTYRPRVVVIEFNPTIPNNIYFTQDKDMSVNHGSSLLALIHMGKKKGYQLVATTKLNAIFVINEAYQLLGIPDNSIDAIHSTGDYESVFFQLYDTTLVLAGCITSIWGGRNISQEEIQITTSDRRKPLRVEA